MFSLLRLPQESILQHQELAKDRGLALPPFNLILASDWEGPIDTSAIEFALNAVISRHASLRSAIRPNPAVPELTRKRYLEGLQRKGLFRPGQYVMEEVEATVRLKLRHVGHDMSFDHEVCSVAKTEWETGWLIDEPPLVRATLVTMAQARATLLVTLPHIIADRHSLQIVHDEIVEAYVAVTSDRTVFPLPRMRTSPRDVAAAEHLLVDSAFGSQELVHWQRWWGKWSGADLRIDRVDGAIGASSYTKESVDECSRPIDGSAMGQIDHLLKILRATRYMLLVTALGIALAEVAHRRRAIVWGPYCNRFQPNTQSVVGMLFNLHGVGVDISRSPSLQECLLQVRQGVVEALTYQHVPFIALACLGVLPLRRATITCDLVPSAFKTTSIGQLRIVRRHLREVRHDGGIRVAMLEKECGAKLTLTFDERIHRKADMETLLERTVRLFCGATAMAQSRV